MDDAMIEDIFRFGDVEVLGGQRGAGKTAFLAWMAKAVMSERLFLGHRTHRPSEWITIITDRGSKYHEYFWRMAGWNEPGGPGRVLCIDEVYTKTKELRAFLKREDGPEDLLHSLLDKVRPAPRAHVVLDVGNPFIGSVQQGYNIGWLSGKAMREEARDRGILLTNVAHGGKPKKNDAYERLTDRIIGGSGFLGSMDTVCYLTTKSETGKEGLQEFVWEPHMWPAENFPLQWSKDEGLFEIAVESVETTEDDVSSPWPTQWTTYYDIVPDEDNPDGAFLTTEAIAQRTGIPLRTVQRHLRRMERQRILVNRGDERVGRWQRRVVLNTDVH